MFVSPGTALED